MKVIIMMKNGGRGLGFRKGRRGRMAAVKHQNRSPKELGIIMVYSLVAY